MKYLLFKLRTSAITGNNSSKWSGYDKEFGTIRKLSDKDYEKFLKISDGKTYWSHRFPDGWFISFSLQLLSREDATKIKKNLEGVCGYDGVVDEILSIGKIEESLI